MNLSNTIRLYGYGTSEGAKKGWESRERSSSQDVPVSGRMIAGQATGMDLHYMRTNFRYIELNMARDAPQMAEALLHDIGKSNDPTKTFVVKDEQGRLSGALRYFGPTGGLLEVGYLAVHPEILSGEREGKGIGTQLMVEAAKKASAAGVGLTLCATSYGEGFYRKLGMHENPLIGQFTWSREEVKVFAQHGDEILKKYR